MSRTSAAWRSYQFDAGFFALDDWRARPNLTLSLGLRYEFQARLSDHRDFAPRVGLAWSSFHAVGRPPSPFLVATSGRPFNITVGRDLNGDTLFTDRPVFATDLTRSSVRQTAFGALDLAPAAGRIPIPRNYGDGPAQVSVNLRVAKVFKLGHEAKGKRDPMELTVTALSRNLLNHPNLALPVGNLSSPLFGESTAFVSGGGGNSASGNRRIELQIKLGF